YLAARDALIAALETAGPGELVHPYHGTRRVICSSFRVRESSRDGGMAVFSIEFEETDAQPAFPAAAIDGAALVEQSVVAARAAMEAEFTSVFDTEGQPAGALASLSAIVRSAAETLEAKLAP